MEYEKIKKQFLLRKLIKFVFHINYTYGNDKKLHQIHRNVNINETLDLQRFKSFMGNIE